MSAFLGPIHYWLYNKIQWHEDLLEQIYDLMKEKGHDGALIKHYTETTFGAPERSELSSVIDGGNIHGWLQSKIQSLEYRMAYVITQILKDGIITFDDLKALYYADGKRAVENYTGSMASPQEVFKAIYDHVLEGMPCDRVNQPLSADEQSMVWIKKLCIHSEYWQAVGGDVKHHDLLRAEWLKGFVSGEFELTVDENNQYTLMRRAA